MANAQWKRCGRRIVAMLGGRRFPVTGRQRGDELDIEHDWLSIEIKERKALPGWLLDALVPAEAAAQDSQPPIAVFHESGSRSDHALVVIKRNKFIRTFRTGERA